MPLDDTGQAPDAPAPAATQASSAPPAGTVATAAPPPSAPDIRGLIDQSRKMGASDEQIRDLMVKAPFLQDTWQASEKAGISPNAVFQHFGLAPPMPAGASEPMTAAQMYGGVSTDAKPAAQSQAAADVNAVGQGLVGGTGSVIAGTGRQITAASNRAAPGQLAAMDAIDRGEIVPADQDPIGYGAMSDEQKASMRADFPAAAASFAAHDENAITKAGTAIENAAPTMFPVSPENEGFQTGAGRLIGNIGPAAVAAAASTAIAGPAGGFLATAVAIGAQTFDSTYKDATAKGATPAEADDAAGKASIAQMAIQVLPLGRAMAFVPVPLREGFVKTLVNIGQSGIEVGGANALGTLAQNYVAQQSYDPSRSLTQGIGTAGLEGVIAGLVIRGGGAAAQAARANAAAPEAVAAIGAAPDINGVIAAAAKATAGAPGSAMESASSWGDLFSSSDAGGQPAPRTSPQVKGLLQAAVDILRPVGGDESKLSDTDTSQLRVIQSQLNRLYDPMGAGMPHVVESAAPAPALESVGAAANPAGGDLSISDMKANRRRAEQDQIIAPPKADDTMIYVPGSFPTLAERSGDPDISQYENLLRQRNPGAFIGDGKILTENNKARVNLFDQHTIPDPTLNSMRADRLARWNAASEQILPTAKPADLTPVLDWVQQQLDNPRIQENDAVRGVLENFRNRLVGPDGSLKTDPAAVWGIHDNLQNQLAKAKDPLSMTSAEKYAEAQLLTAKGHIDQALNVATDNRFQAALDGYAQDSKAINSGVLLNDFRPNLTNMAGDIQANRFHNFVARLAKERGDPGIDPSMDISDQTMQALINIDTDLKRAGLISLGKAAGSPTNLLTALATKAGLDAAHSLIGGVPVVGPMLASGQKYLAQLALIKDTKKHISPPEGGYSFPEPDEPQASPAPAGSSQAPAPPPAPDLFNQPPAVQPPQADAAAAPGRMDAHDTEALAAGWRRVAPDEPRTAGQEIATDPRTGRQYMRVAQDDPQSTGPTQLEREQAAVAAMKDRAEQARTAAAPAAPAPPPFRGHLYDSTTTLTPAGNPVAIRYVVREASDLTPSQLPDGRANPAFPPELQPRDRTRAASEAQVTKIANTLQPERLGYASDTSAGAPVIGPDGVVESGNGRTMAIQRAYAEGSAAADAYRTWLAGQGFDVAGMRQPVLVRERTEPLDMAARSRLADEMGASTTMAMSASERAAADAKRIPTDVLSMYQSGDVTSPRNAAFVRAFADHAIPGSEQASFMTSDGELSMEGATRVRNALTQRAYGDNALVTSLAENADPDIKMFGSALVDAAGPMAKLRGAIESGTVSPSADISAGIVEAAKLIQTAKRARISLADAVAQTDAFSVRDPWAERILQETYGDDFKGRMSRPKLAGMLSSFADTLQVQSGLFGDNKTVTQVFDEAAQKYGHGTSGKAGE